MSPRSVLGLVLAFLVLGVGYYIADANRALLREPLTLWTLPGQTEPVRVPVGHAFLLCVGLGAVAVALPWAMRGTRSLAVALIERRAAKVEQETETTYQQGLEALLGGRPERALAFMSEVLGRDPEHSGALMTGADILRSLGRPNEAAEWRAKRLVVAPDDVAALYALAEDQRACGDLRLAAATYEKLLTLRPKHGVTAAERLVDVLTESGEYERALAAHERLAKMRSDAPEGSVREDLHRAGLETRWALEQAQHDRRREAAALLRRVLKRHPRHVPAYLALARVLLLDGREDLATDTWVEGFERTNEAAILVAAEQHFLDRQYEGDPIERVGTALQAFKRFAACSGSRPLAVAFLGKLYTRHEMLDEARAAFESVRESFPDNPTFTYYLARIAEKQGQHVLAASLYRSIVTEVDVLRLRFRCINCSAGRDDYADRCAACGAWGAISLETGLPAPGEALASRPRYAVPLDDTGKVEQDALA